MSEPENKKGLLDMTDEELRKAYRQRAERVDFSYNDYYREIERRSQEKQSKAMWAFTFVIAVSTLIATLVAVTRCS